MRSLKLEQVAVIKFLTLEGSSSQEISDRLKNVFSTFTLPKEKIFKLRLRFLKEGLLGLREKLYVDEMSDNYCPDKVFHKDQPVITKTYSHRKRRKKCESLGLEEPEAPANDEMKHEVEEAPPSGGRMKRKASLKAKQTWRDALISVKARGDPSIHLMVKEEDEEQEEEEDEEAAWEEPVEDEAEILISGVDSFAKVESLSEIEELQGAPAVIPLLGPEESLALLVGGQPPDLACPLCPPGRTFQFRSHLRAHLAAHVRHSLALGSARVLLCKRHCLDLDRGHYHCPGCSTMVSSHSGRVRKHFTRHHAAGGIGPKAPRKLCVSVDPSRGVYLVRGTRARTHAPVHVMRNKEAARCSQELCAVAMEIARVNGKSGLECKHLLQAPSKPGPEAKPVLWRLEESHLGDLSPLEVQRCLTLGEAAWGACSPLVAEWADEGVGTRYFSVFCDDSFAPFGRCLVTLLPEGRGYACTCPFPPDAHFCAYKTIARVYLGRGVSVPHCCVSGKLQVFSRSLEKAPF